MSDKETPELQRERLRQQELKNNLTGNLTDSFNRAGNGSLVELIGSLGWKGTGIVIILMVLGIIIYSVFFR